MGLAGSIQQLYIRHFWKNLQWKGQFKMLIQLELSPLSYKTYSYIYNFWESVMPKSEAIMTIKETFKWIAGLHINSPA